MSSLSYARHRFPPAIIQHAVWLYFRFTLSYRDVEDMLAERGIDVSYETVRRWVLKFGRIYADRIRRRRPRRHCHGNLLWSAASSEQDLRRRRSGASRPRPRYEGS